MHDKLTRTGITGKIRGPLNEATGGTLSLMLASADVIDACDDEIERLQKLLHDQFLDWHDVDCKFQRPNVMTCTCGHVEVAAALFGTEHEI